MTQEEKQLLLRDLCARLPYEVKVCARFNTGSRYTTNVTAICADRDYIQLKQNVLHPYIGSSIEDIRPYLRPMSSMTEEEQEEFGNFVGLWKYNCGGSIRFVNRLPNLSGEFAKTLISEIIIARAIDWLNKHHFDYRGLIPMGLALEATDDMYEKD